MALPDTRPLPTTTARRPLPRLPFLLAALAAAFLLAPGSVAHKTHAALHGLCAQTPGHTFTFGGQGLPFDARMTGIYGGFLVAAAYLLARGRHRAFRLPGWPTLAALGAGVALMGLDGTNSLLRDLGLWHPYPPANLLRLLTGLTAGIALAACVCFLFATTLWRSGRNTPTVTGLGELALLTAFQTPFALAVLSGAAWLHAPLALLLLLAAVAAVGGLMLVVVVLLRGQENAFTAPAQLERPAALALLLALAVITTLAAGRFLLEHHLGVPPMA